MHHSIKIKTSTFDVPPDQEYSIEPSEEIKPGDIVGIYGQNGSGKTTLLRKVRDDISSNENKIVSTNQSLRLSYKPQKLEELLPPWLSGNRLLNVFVRDGTPVTGKHFISPDRRTVPCGNLSGGQRQLLALQLSLSRAHDIILLDEPFVGLDTTRTHDIMVLIREHCQKRGKVGMVVIHEPVALQFISDWFLFLNDAANRAWPRRNPSRLSERDLRDFNLDSEVYAFCQNAVTSDDNE